MGDICAAVGTEEEGNELDVLKKPALEMLVPTPTAQEPQVEAISIPAPITLSETKVNENGSLHESKPMDIPTKPLVPAKPKKIPFNQLFVPKLRLLKTLFEVDPLAGWLVGISVFINGFAKAWTLSYKCQALTMFQEAILARSIHPTTIVPLLMQQLVLELILQMSIYLGEYAMKRYKKKLRKRLTEDLLEAFGHLPYTTRIDRYTIKRYCWVCFSSCVC